MLAHGGGFARIQSNCEVIDVSSAFDRRPSPGALGRQNIYEIDVRSTDAKFGHRVAANSRLELRAQNVLVERERGVHPLHQKQHVLDAL